MELVNQAQNYAWGRKSQNSLVYKLISHQEKQPQDQSQYYAELWMGSHPKSPSSLILNQQGDKISLPEYLESEGKALPFLFKVLSIRKCLSLQMHPNKKQAEHLHQEFPEIYKDDNHKPEMCIALEDDFICFGNFTKVENVAMNLKRYSSLLNNLGSFIKRLERLVESQETNGETQELLYKDLIDFSTTLEPSVTTEIKNEIEKIPETERTFRDQITLEVINQFPGDTGVIVTLLMNLLKLKKGEAFLMQPNEPHAYFSGECIEGKFKF